MISTDPKLQRLRTLINENLRIQQGGDETPSYIDVGNVLGDICAKQNHAVFARRGCGKTLLLHDSGKKLSSSVKSVYLNCEDFKQHSFPNVLIEILDALFRELERHLKGWFGKKKRSREVIRRIREELVQRREAADSQVRAVTNTVSSERASSTGTSAKVGAKVAPLDIGIQAESTSGEKSREETQQTFNVLSEKTRDLDMWLPRLKNQVRDFFELSDHVKAVFLQIDDLYHLKKADQPFVVDYIHRLCKDLPLYFKIATLRHASTLYADRQGQPIGAQERHDYQPINIDYTFSDFKRTRDQNRKILGEFAKRAGMKPSEVDDLFKGAGFDRLVMAGGGVPRDTLSLFLEVLSTAQAEGDGRIGKDDVRILSRSNFERRIDELKQDSEGGDQDALMRGIYALREFCLNKQTNVFLVSERVLQQQDAFRSLIYRLLDYRIIHNAGVALTHKSQTGTYQAFAIDIGCYAHLRKLEGRFNELDVSADGVKEKMRSAPILEASEFDSLRQSAPASVERALLEGPNVNATTSDL